MYALLGIYCFFIIGLSFFYGRRTPNEVFLISGRDRPASHIMASKFAAAVGVSTFITYTSYAYSFSTRGVLALISGAALGYLAFAVWAAPKIKQYSLGQSFYTQGDLVRFITVNDTCRTLTDGVTLVIQFFWALLGLVGGATVMAEFGLLSYEWGLLLTATILLIYLLLSGLKAVILTDVLQMVIILALLSLLVVGLLWNGERDVLTLLQTPAPQLVTLPNVLGLALYGGFSVFGLADRYQLCYAARDAKAAQRGMAWALLPVIIVVFLLLLVGLEALSTHPNLDADSAFLYVVDELLSHHWQPVLLLLFFAALMSSVDTSIFAVASHCAFLLPTKDKVRATRRLIVLVVVVATVIAFFWKSIVGIALVGAALRMTLAWPMIYIISRGNNTGRFITTVVLGIVGLLIGLLSVGVQPLLIPIVLLGSGLGLLYKSKDDERYWS